MNNKIKNDEIVPNRFECKKNKDAAHHHRGKSSECLLDKNIILKELNILPCQTILDAGCGNGYMAREFSKLLNGTGKVYAMDTDEDAIEILIKETKGTNIKPLLADITKTTPIESSSLDLIYMSTVFHGFEKDRIPHFQKEVERLLKPEGLLAILEIKKEDTPFGPPLNLRYSPEEMKQIIKLIPKTTTEIGPYFYLQIFENSRKV